jgi:hypothetical protein
LCTWPPPARAFSLFTEHTKDWWKKETPFVTEPNRNFFIANTAEGLWVERGEDGGEMIWGKVLAYEPPGGGSIITLEHRDLERFGKGAEPMIAAMRAGWAHHVEEFAQFADRAN